MKRIRIWLVAATSWFFLLYNVERLGEPFNLASFVYIYTALWAVLMVLIPVLYRLPFYWSFFMALPPYFVMKSQLGYSLGGSNIPLTVTEICAIGLTIFLVGQISRGIEQLRRAVSDITVAPLREGTYPFEEGQSHIYREIRRARLYERPATLLAIAATEEAVNGSLDSMIQEAQHDLLRAYINARIANFLVTELQDCSVVTQRNNHFITLIPEVGCDNVQETISKLQAAAEEKLGLKFKIGLSTFPDQAVTFERLLERAEAQMAEGVPSPDGQSELAPAGSQEAVRA